MKVGVGTGDGSLDGALAIKVASLLQPRCYPGAVDQVTPVETHMSWVFLAGNRAYKLKKPLCRPYLDFSTLKKREAACRAEVVLNRRLAPDIYLDVVPLCRSRQGFKLAGKGEIVDWLVVMNRVDHRVMLDACIGAHTLQRSQLEQLERVLVRFYRHARPVFFAPARYLAHWRTLVADCIAVLGVPELDLPVAQVSLIARAQRTFLARHGDILVRRLRAGRVVDAHGDLRPEHIWLGERVAIIDCLEFNAEFRAVDPFDELSSLAVECERLGARSVGDGILRRVGRALPDAAPSELRTFYRCYRATLRARLAIAHLLEANPRTPQKWHPLARAYLAIARREALKLERLIRRRSGPQAIDVHEGGGWRRRTGV